MKLMKVWMEGCGPCKALSQMLKTVDHPLVASMEDVNADEHPEVAAQYGIRSVPVMMLVDEAGTVIKRHNGFMAKDQFLKWIEV